MERRVLKFAAVVVLGLFLGGGTCVSVKSVRSAPGMVPVLPTDPRPKLENLSEEDLKAFNGLPEPTQQKLIENNNRLQLEAKKLRGAIDKYNNFAEKRNESARKALGLDQGADEKEKEK